MSKKQPLTLEEHKELGNELKCMARRLVYIASRVGGAYPTTKSYSKRANAYLGLLKAEKGLSEARCELDNILCADYPEQFDTHIYYGDCKDV